MDDRLCLQCGSSLEGKGSRAKYCSRKCKSTYNNFNGKAHKIYSCQKALGYKRKEELIQLKGGSCIVCGYNKSFRAMTFHHRDPSVKSFQLDVRHLGNRSMKTCLEEAGKCDLLCFNCHMELHEQEELDKVGTLGFEPRTKQL